MFNFVSMFKMYYAVIALSLTITGMYIYIKQQDKQIALQEQILKKEKQNTLMYRKALDSASESAKMLNDYMKKIESSKKDLTEKYEEHQRNIENHFEKISWDNEKLPDVVYCSVMCLRKQYARNSACPCATTAGDTTELHK